MAIPQVAVKADNNVIRCETSEVKKRMEYHQVDESLSEWELARLTSKTWSMEQE